MGKFIDTQRKIVIDSLIEGFKDKIQNPYYIHADKKPFICTYYNLNTSMSTLDEGSKLAYSAIGHESPLRFNKIENMFLYGGERLIAELENGDYGMETNTIEGELIVLPNTITPYPNDYFCIDHTNEKYLFKVLSVTTDTLESGANFWKIQYKLDRHSENDILDQVVDEFTMILNNVGTNFNSIIRSNDYDFIERIDSMLLDLKKYYKALFYSERVQTFVFNQNGFYFYDPYMIEFLIRNKLMEGDKEFIYIDHQLYIPSTFVLDYDRSYFKCIEDKDKSKLELNKNAYGTIINNPTSILSSRIEDYYEVTYIKTKNIYNSMLSIVDDSLIEKINNNSHDDTYTDIIVDYFNNSEITTKHLELLDSIDFYNNSELFYNIPVIIFIFEAFVRELLK